MSGKKLPDDPLPNANDRFEKLLGIMAPKVVEIPEGQPEELDEGRDEGYGDTQTPTDTSEDAS